MRAWKIIPLLFLAACSGSVLGKAPEAPELYTLKAEKTAKAVPAVLPVTLKVALPHVAPGLDTARIAVQDKPHHLTYYTGAEWAAMLPDLAQAFFTDAFEKSGAFRVTGADTDPMRSQATLLLDIQENQVDLTGSGPVVCLRLTAKMVETESREALSSLSVQREAAAESNTTAAIIAAFNLAYNQAFEEIFEFATSAAEAVRDVKRKPKPRLENAPLPSHIPTE